MCESVGDKPTSASNLTEQIRPTMIFCERFGAAYMLGPERW